MSDETNTLEHAALLERLQRLEQQYERIMERFAISDKPPEVKCAAKAWDDGKPMPVREPRTRWVNKYEHSVGGLHSTADGAAVTPLAHIRIGVIEVREVLRDSDGNEIEPEEVGRRVAKEVEQLTTYKHSREEEFNALKTERDNLSGFVNAFVNGTLGRWIEGHGGMTYYAFVGDWMSYRFYGAKLCLKLADKAKEKS